jgi:hypothetical protein
MTDPAAAPAHPAASGLTEAVRLIEEGVTVTALDASVCYALAVQVLTNLITDLYIGRHTAEPYRRDIDKAIRLLTLVKPEPDLAAQYLSRLLALTTETAPAAQAAPEGTVAP